MPRPSDGEIKRMIETGEISAISIDTQVFDALGRNYRHPLLTHLGHLHSVGIEVILSDVVANEMKAHFCETAKDARDSLETAAQKYSRIWKSNSTENEYYSSMLKRDPNDFSKAEFDEFLRRVRGQVVSAAGTPGMVADVLDRYFDHKRPFGSGKNRKNEFPDAFALLTLENYAANKRKGDYIRKCRSPATCPCRCT